MKVLYVTSEAAPFAKTGGLGDVSAALPVALAAKKVSTRVVMPLYGSIAESLRREMKFVRYFYVPLAWRNQYCGLFELKRDGVVWYFLDNEYYFKRGDIYGHFDDGERFAFFSRAVTVLVNELDWKPDVVHCNDWQTALVPIYMRKLCGGLPAYDRVRTAFTIHNVEYQGRFGRDALKEVFGLPDSLFSGGTLEFMGGINLMKGAIELSDRVTTVSPTYADELGYAFYAHGLEGVLSASRGKLSGILNGIDTTLYDPSTDMNIAARYTPDDLSGKDECKASLQKLLGLLPRPDTLLITMVTRLVGHKGLDLVTAALNEIVDMDVQLAVVGRGDWHYEQFFQNAQTMYQGRLSASILYNPSLAMKMYAGGDVFLMPSQAEPCGLSQMIAMRYGNLPVVRETGGLKDTVAPYNAVDGSGGGFTFSHYTKEDMTDALRRAAALYRENKAAWRAMQRRGMTADLSWKASAKTYMAMYKQLTIEN